MIFFGFADGSISRKWAPNAECLDRAVAISPKSACAVEGETHCFFLMAVPNCSRSSGTGLHRKEVSQAVWVMKNSRPTCPASRRTRASSPACALSWSVKKVIALPLRPARPVRPMRCCMALRSTRLQRRSDWAHHIVFDGEREGAINHCDSSVSSRQRPGCQCANPIRLWGCRDPLQRHLRPKHKFMLQHGRKRQTILAGRDKQRSPPSSEVI